MRADSSPFLRTRERVPHPCGKSQADRPTRLPAGRGPIVPSAPSATIRIMRTATHATPLFSRNLRKPYPVAVRGEGSWIFDASGRRYLDASGQAAVVSIGHGVEEIGRAMAAQSSQIAFVHTTQFHSEPAEKLAARVLALAPRNFQNGGRVYFTSGGSEATETAIKLARQYFLEREQPCPLPHCFAEAELSRQYAR